MELYIGKKECGCVVFACRIDKAKEYLNDVAESVAEAIRDGLVIHYFVADTDTPIFEPCQAHSETPHNE